MNTSIINKFGTMQGWSAITANMMGRDLEGVVKIAYDDTVTKENVKGAGIYPVGRSVTDYEATCSITFLKEEIDALRKSLPAGKRLQDIASFDITIEYAGKDGVITKDRIRNAEFTNSGVDVSQGDGTIEVECEMICSHIEWNVL